MTDVNQREPEIIVEFELGSSLLETTLRDLPDMVLVAEQEVSLDSETAFLDFWAGGDDLDAFERALDAYPVEVTRLSGLIDGRKLYRVGFSPLDSTYPKWVGVGGMLIDGVGTRSGWEIRMQFPDRDALAAYRDFCREEGFEMRTRRLYKPTGSDRNDFDLTPGQREVLRTALAEGYFEIPREVTMNELADRFDVSSQAVSERLRRGLATVLRRTPI